MAASSNPPAACAAPSEPIPPAQNKPKANDPSTELKTTNTAPLAEDVVNTKEGPEASSKMTDQAGGKTDDSISHDDGHGQNPLDFDGAVDSNNEIPSAETLRKIENYVVLDRDGRTHPFKSLYSGKHVARRVLVIFVRHFFCGVCQEYIRTLSAAITPDALLRLPISTFITVVGCGDQGLIEMYASATGCPFPIYADPTQKLYSELGMVRTLALGSRPAYMKKSLLKSSIESIVQGLKQIPKGLATKGGDQRQIGGEFLFEPLSLFTPLSTPWTEGTEGEKRLGGPDEKQGDTVVNGGGNGGATPNINNTNAVGTGSEASLDGLPGSDAASTSAADADPKRVTWCHRMRTTRDHAEIPELMEVLGLDPIDASKPPRAEPDKDDKESGKRWSRALEMRKGTGLSMASQMSTMKAGTTGTSAPAVGGS